MFSLLNKHDFIYIDRINKGGLIFVQRLTKRNIKVINHDTGQQIDFPTFGKEAGEDAYN